VLLSQPGEITETTWNLCLAASGAVIVGFQQPPMASKARRRPMRKRPSYVRDLRGDLQAAGRTFSLRRWRAYSSQRCEATPGEAGCGPFFQYRKKTARCRLVYITQRQAAAQLQVPVASRPKQVVFEGDLDSCVDTRTTSQRRVATTVSEVPASAAIVIRQLARQRIASRPTSWSPRRRKP